MADQTIIDLAKKVKAKFPGEYDNYDDADLGRKVKAKFPGEYDHYIDITAPAMPAGPVPGMEKLGGAAPGPAKLPRLSEGQIPRFLGAAYDVAGTPLVQAAMIGRDILHPGPGSWARLKKDAAPLATAIYNEPGRIAGQAKAVWNGPTKAELAAPGHAHTPGQIRASHLVQMAPFAGALVPQLEQDIDRGNYPELGGHIAGLVGPIAADKIIKAAPSLIEEMGFKRGGGDGGGGAPPGGPPSGGSPSGKLTIGERLKSKGTLNALQDFIPYWGDSGTGYKKKIFNLGKAIVGATREEPSAFDLAKSHIKSFDGPPPGEGMPPPPEMPQVINAGFGESRVPKQYVEPIASYNAGLGRDMVRPFWADKYEYSRFKGEPPPPRPAPSASLTKKVGGFGPTAVPKQNVTARTILNPEDIPPELLDSLQPQPQPTPTTAPPSPVEFDTKQVGGFGRSRVPRQNVTPTTILNPEEIPPELLEPQPPATTPPAPTSPEDFATKQVGGFGRSSIPRQNVEPVTTYNPNELEPNLTEPPAPAPAPPPPPTNGFATKKTGGFGRSAVPRMPIVSRVTDNPLSPEAQAVVDRMVASGELPSGMTPPPAERVVPPVPETPATASPAAPQGNLSPAEMALAVELVKRGMTAEDAAAAAPQMLKDRMAGTAPVPPDESPVPTPDGGEASVVAPSEPPNDFATKTPVPPAPAEAGPAATAPPPMGPAEGGLPAAPEGGQGTTGEGLTRPAKPGVKLGESEYWRSLADPTDQALYLNHRFHAVGENIGAAPEGVRGRPSGNAVAKALFGKDATWMGKNPISVERMDAITNFMTKETRLPTADDLASGAFVDPDAGLPKPPAADTSLSPEVATRLAEDNNATLAARGDLTPETAAPVAPKPTRGKKPPAAAAPPAPAAAPAPPAPEPAGPQLLNNISTGTKDPKLRATLEKYTKYFPDWSPETAGQYLSVAMPSINKSWSAYSPAAFEEYARGIKQMEERGNPKPPTTTGPVRPPLAPTLKNPPPVEAAPGEAPPAAAPPSAIAKELQVPTQEAPAAAPTPRGRPKKNAPVAAEAPAAAPEMTPPPAEPEPAPAAAGSKAAPEAATAAGEPDVVYPADEASKIHFGVDTLAELDDFDRRAADKIRDFRRQNGRYPDQVTDAPSIQGSQAGAPQHEGGDIGAKLDKIADAANKRMKDSGAFNGTNLQANFPAQHIPDMAIWGAAKMAKGVVNFGKWSREMLADAGDAAETLRPQLREVYAASQKALERHIKSTAGELPKTRQLLSMYKKGIEGQDWYRYTMDEITKVFGPKDGPLFVNFLAATSPNSTVAANTALALKAYTQYKTGQPFTGYLGQVIESLDKVVAGEEFGSAKVQSFKANLFGDPTPVTVDRWIARAFGFKGITPGQYKFMDYALTQIARERGLEPRQMQAAIWKTIKEAQGAAGNTSDAFEKVLHRKIAKDPRLRGAIEQALKAGDEGQ